MQNIKKQQIRTGAEETQPRKDDPKCAQLRREVAVDIDSSDIQLRAVASADIDPSDIQLRKEQPADYRAVEELTREAFWNHYAPGCDEHYLVHIMRKAECFIEELDYIAVSDRPVGNIMYAKSKIACDDGEVLPVITFGPLSVLPAYQGKGVGCLLIRHTLKLARDAGWKAVLIYGDPDYYSRFGFVPAETYGIATADDKYAAALQALELQPGALSNCHGRYVDDDIYKIDEAESCQFDRGIEPKERKEGLPSQQKFLKILAMQKPRNMK